jgi:hypothetical protein
LASLSERVASLEQIVTRLVEAQRATNLEALLSIQARVVELNDNVQESNRLMQDFLPPYKQSQPPS